MHIRGRWKAVLLLAKDVDEHGFKCARAFGLEGCAIICIFHRYNPTLASFKHMALLTCKDGSPYFLMTPIKINETAELLPHQLWELCESYINPSPNLGKLLGFPFCQLGNCINPKARRRSSLKILGLYSNTKMWTEDNYYVADPKP